MVKYYDSYIVYGCHFPEHVIKIIETNSSINYFNKKIRNQYNCEILELLVPVRHDLEIKKYFLSICTEKSDPSILLKVDENDCKKFKDFLVKFDLDEVDPYFISVPVVRDLPSIGE